MPLSSHLPLPASPRSVAEARRWVGRICRELGRHDLVESAELGVSELVTNAVLHARSPITVRVRGTASHPRIEVGDGSPEPPVPPGMSDEEDVLTTFGRGLAIVARTASSWGASIEPSGKIVWFEPVPDLRDDDNPQWILDRDHHLEHEVVSESALPVTLANFDLQIYRTLGRQYAELRRELRLLSLGHQNDYPLAGNLTAMFDTFERQFPADYQHQIQRAMADGRTHTDVTVPLMPESASIFVTMGEMFDVADAFCRAERLLSLARTDEQRAFNNWMLTELIRQLGGGDPQPWQGQGATESSAASASQVG